MSEPKKIIPLHPAIEEGSLGFADAGGACTEAEPFALMVKGDSMEPEFNDGHIIMVDPSMPPINGCYVVAEHDGGYIFRQFRIHDGKQYLQPLHDGYPTLELENKQAIVGVITQRSGRRRRETKHYI
jgi:phage repressor protein C with HTH and peptisase S24 domain